MADRFDVQQHDDGQIYITENGDHRLHALLNESITEIQVQSDQPITIEKLYGPLVFWPVRVTADLDSGDWIIERQHGSDNKWREAARIPGQLESDFTEVDVG